MKSGGSACDPQLPNFQRVTHIMTNQSVSSHLLHASASLVVVRQAEEGPELWRVNGTLAVVPLHRARP